MVVVSHYFSPIGNLFIAVMNDKLIGLWMEGHKYSKQNVKAQMIEQDDHVMIVKIKNWLDRYFHGEQPNIHELELELIGSDFQKRVWEILMEIPYGSVITYKDIAEKLSSTFYVNGLRRMSAQAVGGAVGRNPILIIIPCHRVIGTNGSLTGYAGGIQKKIYLLNHEHVNMEQLFVPKKGTSLL